MSEPRSPTPSGALTGDDVTVVVPTRDRPELLERALRSVLNQTVRPKDVFVVEDGGISPSTRSVVEGTRSDGRVAMRLLSSTGGAPRARNVGLAAVTTEYIAFLDDDDFWRPTFLERTLEVLQTRSAPTAVFTAALIVRIDGPHQWNPVVRDAAGILTANGGYGGQNGVLPTEAVRAVNGWDETLVAFQDRDLQLRLALHGLEFEVWPEPLTVIDQSHDRSRITTTRRADGCWQFTRKWWAWAPLRRRPELLCQLALNQRTAGTRWRRALARFTALALRSRDLLRRTTSPARYP